jgi:glycosyltransferase involved in cell wall biosynthesis
MADGSRILFLTYDGLEDHIAQSQILPYVEGLAARGWKMTVVSHEKANTASEALAARLRTAGIRWIRERYHRGRVVTSLPRHVSAAVAAGAREAFREGRFDIVHARSYLPGIAASILARSVGARFLFDMRGFWVDEKIDAGNWQRGAMFDAGKRVERHLFGRADGVISLTNAGRDELMGWPELMRRKTPISVIPTCVDLERFEPARPPRGSRPLRMGYVGSLGERYPIEGMARVFARIRKARPDARWSILTHADPKIVHEACARVGVSSDAVDVTMVSFEDVPRHLASMDVTISFVKPSFATLATCPTKFAESLATGLPVVVNEGIGDCAALVRNHRVGAVTDLSVGSLERAADEVLALLTDPELAARCRKVAREHFDLERALDTYESTYRQLLARPNVHEVSRNRGGV